MNTATLFERRVDPSLQSIAGVRHEVGAFVAAAATAAVRSKVELVVSELCTNAIEAEESSSVGAAIVVRVATELDRFCIEVEDGGPGFPDRAWEAPSLASQETQRGRGLHVVRALVDELTVERREGRTIVRAVMARPERSARAGR